jgi:hypothetical protein
MDWIDRLKDMLFGEPVRQSGHLHHGPLKRSEEFLRRHERWLKSAARNKLLEHYREMLHQEQRTADTELHLFGTEQATGVQITRSSFTSPEALRHLLEEFKDKVIAEGYRLHLSDHRISPKGEERERYYLKPSIASDKLDPPLPQRYGNVLIENWGNGRDPDHLKVLITVYNDRLYSAADSGMALINSLFEERGRVRN